MSVINLYSLYLLVQCGKRIRAYSYEQVASAAFGRRAVVFTNIVIATGCMGAIVSFVIVLGDVVPPILRFIMQIRNAKEFWYLDRRFIAAIVTITCIIPLGLISKRMSSLRITSFLVVICFIYLVVAIMIRSIETLSTDWERSFSLVSFSLDTFQTIPIFAYALGCHLQILPLYGELQNKKLMEVATFTANTITTSLYLVIGTFAYIAFQEETPGNILLYFSNHDHLILAARLLIAATIILTYPIVLVPLRFTLEVLFCNGRKASTLRYVFLTVLLIVISYVLATLVPEISIVKAYAGAASAILSNYILPPAFYIKLVILPSFDKRKITSWVPLLACVTLAIVGCVVGVASTVAITIDTVHQLVHPQ